MSPYSGLGTVENAITTANANATPQKPSPYRTRVDGGWGAGAGTDDMGASCRNAVARKRLPARGAPAQMRLGSLTSRSERPSGWPVNQSGSRGSRPLIVRTTHG